jgi:hypothetical protein
MITRVTSSSVYMCYYAATRSHKQAWWSIGCRHNLAFLFLMALEAGSTANGRGEYMAFFSLIMSIRSQMFLRDARIILRPLQGRYPEDYQCYCARNII